MCSSDLVIIEGTPAPPDADDGTIVASLQHELANGSDRRTAIATVMAATGASKKRVYDLALTIPRSPA